MLTARSLGEAGTKTELSRLSINPLASAATLSLPLAGTSMKELEGGARQKSNEHVFNAEMKLAIDKDIPDSDVIKAAGVIWDEVYPSARASGSARDVRIDKGSKRPSKDHGNIIFTSLFRKQ